ncbi:MAG: hypothetical protein RLZZ380_1096 [Actinomycetota bacterium]|jgi:hypothetical protein
MSKESNKFSSIIGYAFGAALIIWGMVPMWALCSDACVRNFANAGLISLGVTVLALNALFQSKLEAGSKSGCSMILLSFLGPVTFLCFAAMSNFWYVVGYAFPAFIVGLVILIFGIVRLSTSAKKK